MPIFPESFAPVPLDARAAALCAGFSVFVWTFHDPEKTEAVKFEGLLSYQALINVAFPADVYLRELASWLNAALKVPESYDLFIPRDEVRFPGREMCVDPDVVFVGMPSLVYRRN